MTIAVNESETARALTQVANNLQQYSLNILA